jgi:hypothetical protein
MSKYFFAARLAEAGFSPTLPDFSWYIIPNGYKIYQMTTKYTNWPYNRPNDQKYTNWPYNRPNDPKIYIPTSSIARPSIIGQSEFFGLKIHHLASLLLTCFVPRYEISHQA